VFRGRLLTLSQYSTSGCCTRPSRLNGMYSRIMVTLEHTAHDRCILEHVEKLALHTGAAVILIHVADGFAARNQGTLRLRESEEMRDDRAYLEQCAAQLEQAGIDADA